MAATFVSITGVGGFGEPVNGGACPMTYPGSCRFIGTSAAAPHVAGIAALLLEACTGITSQTLADALNRTAVRLTQYGGQPNDIVGWGRVDALLAKKRACPNPLAEVRAFHIVNGVARWQVESEYTTAGYILEGSYVANGVWVEIAPMEPAGNSEYSVDVSSSGYPLIRLVELETAGTRIIHDVEALGPPSPPEPTLASRETLISMLEGLVPPPVTSAGGQPRPIPLAPLYVIYTTGMFVQDVEDYVADYWEARGYLPVIVNTDSYPPDHDEFRDALRNSIAEHAEVGAKYFHLIGDWNDWREATDPEVYPQLWVDSWESIRQAYIATCWAGQPSKDLIPTYVVPDMLPRGRNMAFGRPYWFSDQYYADVNGDGLPNVVVTRWPVSNDSQLLALAYKMQYYNDAQESQNPYTTSIYAYDIDYTEGTGDGAIVAEVADVVAAEIPSV